ncbi:MAG TPA: hypothetical protein PKM31_01845 [Bacillota bacterium]|nr:hypothetical protein [Bacillota bacterium]
MEDIRGRGRTTAATRCRAGEIPDDNQCDAAAELTYSAQERRRICEDVWRKVGLWYSYFDDKGIDEGHGIPADIVVGPTARDLANGVDTVLAAAMGYLGVR